jgi:hypothetical protein
LGNLSAPAGSPEVPFFSAAMTATAVDLARRFD